MIYKGTVERIDARGAYVKVPQLGGVFGPLLMMCDNPGYPQTGEALSGASKHRHDLATGAWLSEKDTVCVAQWGHTQEDLVILGRAVVPKKP